MPSGQSFDGNESKRLTMFGWSMLFHTYPIAPYGIPHTAATASRGSVVFAHAGRHVGLVSERQYWRALTGTHGYSRVLTGKHGTHRWHALRSAEDSNRIRGDTRARRESRFARRMRRPRAFA